ncbi:MAG TPA: deoxyribonuclease IV [Terriglobales bacterium]|nr:deoxyribonuclease IV [Terriglobales bacterium]
MAIRIGAHISSAGGVEKAAERAHALGCQALQIFTASPRQWRAAPVPAAKAEALRALRRSYQLGPLVVHANYLINLAGSNPEFHRRSLTAFRGELERAAAIGADYLVLHPGSGPLGRCLESLRQAAEGFAWGSLTLLIENTAGGGAHLGGDFGAVAALLDGLAGLPVGACIDTCHAWVAGYDLVSPAGYQATLQQLDELVGLARVPVFHANDAKAERGSHRDRHEHIGAGQLGRAVFRRLLRDPRLRGKAFILETPVDGPDDQARDLAALRQLGPPNPKPRRR